MISLPVPLSPCISTATFAFATFSSLFWTRRITSVLPKMTFSGGSPFAAEIAIPIGVVTGILLLFSSRVRNASSCGESMHSRRQSFQSWQTERTLGCSAILESMLQSGLYLCLGQRDGTLSHNRVLGTALQVKTFSLWESSFRFGLENASTSREADRQ